MFLSDLASLHRVSRPYSTDLNLLSMSPPNGSVSMPTIVKYNTGDPEIDRMYNQSPMITEYASTYLHDSIKIDEKDSAKQPNALNGGISPLFLAVPNGKKSKSDIVFEPRPMTMTAPSAGSSALTQQIESATQKQKDNKNAGKVKLTIFLPDTEAMIIHAAKNATFGQLLLQILAEHKEREIYPALNYEDPEEYELRIHEGDGEPDRDFAPLQNDKFLRDFNLGNEYCLCEVERGDSDFDMQHHNSGNEVPRATSTNDLFSPSQFGTFTSSRSRMDSSGKSNSRGGVPNIIDDEDDDEDDDNFQRRQQYEHSKFVDEDGDLGDEDEDELVNIRFPNGDDINLPFAKGSTFKDLLPQIVKTHRLRLFTDEYIFVVSQQDQKHLKLMSPFIDINAKIDSIGSRVFEIQRKVYADSQAVKKPTKAATMVSRASTHAMNRGSVGDRDSMVPVNAGMTNQQSVGLVQAPTLAAMIASFTEATANAYQEWNVVKKNKYGRKQERIFGVDGRQVYNAKRGGIRGGNSAGVHRAERAISSIVKIEILSDDGHVGSTNNTSTQVANPNFIESVASRTFRITWAEVNDIYIIEYTTDTSRECIEIVAKIKFLLNRLKRQR